MTPHDLFLIALMKIFRIPDKVSYALHNLEKAITSKNTKNDNGTKQEQRPCKEGTPPLEE